MIDDTSFETHRQQETKDFILQLRHLIVEKDAEIERLKALLTRAADALEKHLPGRLMNKFDHPDYVLIDELRKAAE